MCGVHLGLGMAAGKYHHNAHQHAGAAAGIKGIAGEVAQEFAWPVVDIIANITDAHHSQQFLAVHEPA